LTPAMAEADSKFSLPVRSLGSPRIALIGCGAIAERHHLPALSKYPAVMENLILVDRDGARAQDLAARFGAKRSLTEYREVLNEVDAVILTVPTNLHHPIAMECLSRGVHVLCEKPLAENAIRAREMVEEADRNEAVLAANYLQRLWPQFAKTKELLTSQELGAPLSIQYFVGEEFTWPTVSGFYFNTATSSRGVLRDRGAHVLDHICWWLGGRPTVLESQNDSFGGSEAVAHVCLRHEECVVEVRLSWLCKSPSTFTVKCEKASIEGGVYDFGGLSVKEASGRTRRLSLGGRGNSSSDIARKIAGNFVQAVCGRERPLIEGKDVLSSIELIDECYRLATRLDMPWYHSPEAQDGH